MRGCFCELNTTFKVQMPPTKPHCTLLPVTWHNIGSRPVHFAIFSLFLVQQPASSLDIKQSNNLISSLLLSLDDAVVALFRLLATSQPHALIPISLLFHPVSFYFF